MSNSKAADSRSPRRPALRWHGGKWLQAPAIIKYFPPHRVYVESFGGGASVLLRKAAAYAEIYNDLDEGAVTLFRVLQDPASAARLIELLRITPFARAEFELSYEPTNDPIEWARRLLVRSFMGFGSDGHNVAVRTGFRAASNRSGTTPAHDWANHVDCLPAIIERFKGVVIERRPAIDVMRRHDAPDALHYVDPPYMPETRSKKSRRGKVRYHAYAHEMTAEQHEELLDALNALEGMVVLSGYPSDLYDRKLPLWQRRVRESLADGARPRIEVLWLNPQAFDALRREQQTFDFAATPGISLGSPA